MSLQLPRDYQNLLEEFLAAEVEFVLIGGYSQARCGSSRVAYRFQ